jgi:hypothetical protein
MKLKEGGLDKVARKKAKDLLEDPRLEMEEFIPNGISYHSIASLNNIVIE